MAKVKNKQRVSSDAVNKKKNLKGKKIISRFDVLFNKEKIKVLGKKSKNDKGLPGVSRAKAIAKRKGTLLKEYSDQNKRNSIFDRRIGERKSFGWKSFEGNSFGGNGLSDEDKITARFTAERIKGYKKRSIFNLADDILTHRGQTLNEIEKFENPASDDDDDGQFVRSDSDGLGTKSGSLGQSFVEEAHFGGGVLKHTGKEGVTSHKELIDQLIADSKKRKAEKQKLKEATLDLTEKLDEEWKDLLPIMAKKDKGEENKRVIDTYDNLVGQLVFEARGHASNRLKSEEEIAEEKQKKLEKMHQEQLERMNGENQEKSDKHKSADDLNDNFAFDFGVNEEANDDNEGMKRNQNYNWGGESEEDEREEMNDGEVNDDEKVEDNDEKMEGDEFETEDLESCGIKYLSKKVSHTENIDVENIDEESSGEEDSVEGDSDGGLSDLKADSSDSENESQENYLKNIESEENNFKGKLNENKLKERKLKENILDGNKNQHTENCPTTDPKGQSASEKRTPYPLPESYETLQNTLLNKNSFYQRTIIESMIMSNKFCSKDSFGMLFVYLLQHINDLSENCDNPQEVKKCFQTFYDLLPSLFDLANINKESTVSSLVELVREKQNRYRDNMKAFPGLDVILFLKMVTVLFTTSDFRNQVVTPSVVFMEQMLHKCKIRCRRDIAYGLCITALLLEYTMLSKRFLPVAIQFLHNVVKAAEGDAKFHKGSFRPSLVLKSKLSKCQETSSQENLMLHCTDLLEKKMDEEFKVRALCTTLSLLEEFRNNLTQLSVACVLFKPVYKSLECLKLDFYPISVQNQLKRMVESFEDFKSNSKVRYLVQEKKKPKALRLYEPNIQKVYDFKKHKVQSKEKAEVSKLLHKVKRERKGALREIRRDKAFLGRLKVNKQIESDAIRRQKVNQIMAEANVQQSELNTIDRQKKRK